MTYVSNLLVISGLICIKVLYDEDLKSTETNYK